MKADISSRGARSEHLHTVRDEDRREERTSGRSGRDLTIHLEEDFTWEALQFASAEMDVSAEELVGFALLYYLADFDSGRISRHVPLSVTHRRDLEV